MRNSPPILNIKMPKVWEEKLSPFRQRPILRKEIAFYDKTARNKYNYGVELELEFDKKAGDDTLDDYAIWVHDICFSAAGYNKYTVVYDESLVYGFEIALSPMSFRAALKVGHYLYKSDIRRFLSESSTAGMHVTVDPFKTKEQLTTFYNIFNDLGFITKLYGIFGRLPNQYCYLNGPRKSPPSPTPSSKKYVAVRVRPSGGVEVRLFAAPLTADQYSSKLDLVRSVDMMVREGLSEKEIKIAVEKRMVRKYGKKTLQLPTAIV